MNRFSQELERLMQGEAEAFQPLTLAGLLEISQERMFGVLFVALALPMSVPLPHFGLTLPVAGVLVALAGQMLLGHRLPWLPSRVLNYDLRRGGLQRVLRFGLPWLRRLETVARPRLEIICTSLWGKVLLASAILLATVLMVIPLPGTNAPPAVGILLVGVGLLEEDGLLSLVGVGVCLGTVLLAAAVCLMLFLYGFDVFALIPFLP